jgi:transcriptional regulator with XRE-family HTH domain
MELMEVLICIEHNRKKRKYTKRKLCQIAGISPQHYDRLLKDQGSTTFDMVNALLRALDLEILMLPKVPKEEFQMATLR